MKYSFLTVDNQSMSRVMTALKTHHRVSTFGQQVHDFSFALVAPLRADYHNALAHTSKKLLKQFSLFTAA